MDLRVDKWLYFARLYKTRSQAASACNGGRVQVNGERIKSSRPLRQGDILDISKGHERYRLTVLGTPARRGPAKEAQTFYEEDAKFRDARKELRLAMRAERAQMPMTVGRPDKKTRRALRDFKNKD